MSEAASWRLGVDIGGTFTDVVLWREGSAELVREKLLTTPDDPARAVIDGIGPDGVAARVLDVTGRVVKLQSGYVYHYAFVMMIGVALITTYFMFVAGGFGQ